MVLRTFINQLDSSINQLYSSINQLYSSINQLYSSINLLYSSINKLYSSINHLYPSLNQLYTSHHHHRMQSASLSPESDKVPVMARRPIHGEAPFEEGIYRRLRNSPKVPEDDHESSSENDEVRDNEDGNPYGWHIPESYTPQKKEFTFKPTPSSHLTQNPKGMKDQNEFKLTFTKIIIISCSVFLVVGLLIIYRMYFSGPKDFPVNTYQMTPKEERLESVLNKLEKDFPSQDENVWYTFLAGIKSVIRENPNKPSVFLMLYNDNGKTANCLANRISSIAIQYITEKTNIPLILNGQDLKRNRIFIEDSGELITAYNSTVQDIGGMVVTELHEVPGSVAKAFHVFCDRETPLVERAIYFFTLQTPEEKTKIQETAERRMKNLWHQSLTDNLLDPLITRLTGHVLQIQPEYQNLKCGL